LPAQRIIQVGQHELSLAVQRTAAKVCRIR
jgi:hypothetical protein